MSAGQRVRVTIEGTRTPGDPDPVLRLRTDEGALVYVPRNDRGVTLEDMTPERVWTDGDLVQDTGAVRDIWERVGGRWLSHTNKSDAVRDRHQTCDVASGKAIVLRCQADA